MPTVATAGLETGALAPVVRRQARSGRAALLFFLGALWLVLCRHLSGEWSVNEQYNYGWFVPFFAAYLFWLRWESRPEAERRNEKGEGRKVRIAIAMGVVALLTLLPVRLFEVGNPDWRPLGWIHMAAVGAISFLLVWSAGGKAWVRHFAFPIAFFFVAVPWPASFEQTIVQELMRVVAGVATEALNLFGTPAQVEGNLIRVNTGLVGVNEACSGVRSLQTSLMIGLLFGELKMLNVPRRIALVFGAVLIAFVANVGRAFFLVWTAAHEGVAAIDRWHDIAGYAITGLVFLGSIVLVWWLGGSRGKVESRKAKVENGETERRAQRPFLLSTFYFLLCLLWLVAIEIGVEVWYRSHESNAVRRVQWSVRWPESAPEFRELPVDESVKSILRFDAGREASWSLAANTDAPDSGSRPSGTRGDNKSGRCFLFFFRWQPGSSSILRARAHRPDICLPSAGWRQTDDAGVKLYPITSNLSLPFRHFSFARETNSPRQVFAHAFFCVHEDSARPVTNEAVRFDPNSRTPSDWLFVDRWNVVREGLRNPGQQVLEIILMTPNEVSREEAEVQFASLARELVAAESRK